MGIVERWREKNEYKEDTRRRMEMMMEGQQEENKKWDVLAELIVESARKVCGEMGGIVDNPWMIGYEAEVEEMIREISKEEMERKVKAERMKAIERIKERKGETEAGEDENYETVAWGGEGTSEGS